MNKKLEYLVLLITWVVVIFAPFYGFSFVPEDVWWNIPLVIVVGVTYTMLLPSLLLMSIILLST